MISFILPAHNEEELIGAAILAARRSAGALGESHEIIVVNDASTDRTPAIAREMGARVIDVQHRQIAATRNSGARAAAGEIFIFVDGDTMVNPKLLRSALRLLRNGVIGGGCCVHMEGRLPPYGKVLQRVFQMAAPALNLAGGCFLFSSRETYLAAGGFDETLFAAEEVAFSQRLKRLGRFVVLRQRITTSGRKMRMYSGMEILRIFLRIARGGIRTLQQREGLELWYGPRGA